MNFRHLLFSVVVLATPLLAQRGFYLRLGVEQKVNINRDHGSEVTTPQGNRFGIAPSRFFGSGAFNFGLAIGYRTERSFVELAEWQDKGELSTLFTYYQTVQDTIVLLQHVRYKSHNNYSRTSLQYGFLLLGGSVKDPNPRIKWELWGFIAHDFLLGRRVLNYSRQVETVHFNAVDSASITRLHDIPARYNGYGRVGMIVKAFDPKGRSIFNFSVSYKHPLATKEMGKTDFYIMDHSGGYNYVYSTRTLGSGLYFQVSKDLYLDKIFKVKKRHSLEPLLDEPKGNYK